jgi:hypothetical protein
MEGTRSRSRRPHPRTLPMASFQRVRPCRGSLRIGHIRPHLPKRTTSVFHRSGHRAISQVVRHYLPNPTISVFLLSGHLTINQMSRPYLTNRQISVFHLSGHLVINQVSCYRILLLFTHSHLQTFWGPRHLPRRRCRCRLQQLPLMLSLN